MFVINDALFNRKNSFYIVVSFVSGNSVFRNSKTNIFSYKKHADVFVEDS